VLPAMAAAAEMSPAASVAVGAGAEVSGGDGWEQGEAGDGVGEIQQRWNRAFAAEADRMEFHQQVVGGGTRGFSEEQGHWIFG
jgi:hypothetical protein